MSRSSSDSDTDSSGSYGSDSTTDTDSSSTGSETDSSTDSDSSESETSSSPSSTTNASSSASNRQKKVSFVQQQQQPMPAQYQQQSGHFQRQGSQQMAGAQPQGLPPQAPQPYGQQQSNAFIPQQSSGQFQQQRSQGNFPQQIQQQQPPQQQQPGYQQHPSSQPTPIYHPGQQQMYNQASGQFQQQQQQQQQEESSDDSSDSDSDSDSDDSSDETTTTSSGQTGVSSTTGTKSRGSGDSTDSSDDSDSSDEETSSPVSSSTRTPVKKPSRVGGQARNRDPTVSSSSQSTTSSHSTSTSGSTSSGSTSSGSTTESTTNTATSTPSRRGSKRNGSVRSSQDSTATPRKPTPTKLVPAGPPPEVKPKPPVAATVAPTEEPNAGTAPTAPQRALPSPSVDEFDTPDSNRGLEPTKPAPPIQPPQPKREDSGRSESPVPQSASPSESAQSPVPSQTTSEATGSPTASSIAGSSTVQSSSHAQHSRSTSQRPESPKHVVQPLPDTKPPKAEKSDKRVSPKAKKPATIEQPRGPERSESGRYSAADDSDASGDYEGEVASDSDSESQGPPQHQKKPVVSPPEPIKPPEPEKLELRDKIEIPMEPDETVHPLPEAFVVEVYTKEHVAFELTQKVHTNPADPVTVDEYKKLLQSIGVSKNDIMGYLRASSNGTFPYVSVISTLENCALALALERLKAAFKVAEVSAGEVTMEDCTEIIASSGILNVDLEGTFSIDVRAEGARLVADFANAGSSPVAVPCADLLNVQTFENQIICGSQLISSFHDVARVIVAIQMLQYADSVLDSARSNDGLVDYYNVLNFLFAWPVAIPDNAEKSAKRRSLVHQQAIRSVCRPHDRLEQILSGASTKRLPPYLQSEQVAVVQAAEAPVAHPKLTNYVPPISQFYFVNTAPSAANDLYVSIEVKGVFLPDEAVPKGAQRYLLISSIDADGKPLPPVRLYATTQTSEDDSPWLLDEDTNKSVTVVGAPNDIVYIELCYDVLRESLPPSQRSVLPDGEALSTTTQSFCIGFATLKLDTAEAGTLDLCVSGGTFNRRTEIARSERPVNCLCIPGPPASRVEVMINQTRPAGFNPVTYPSRFIAKTNHVEVIGLFRSTICYHAANYYGHNADRTLRDPRIADGLAIPLDDAALDALTQYWPERHKAIQATDPSRPVETNFIVAISELYAMWCITQDATLAVKLLLLQEASLEKPRVDDVAPVAVKACQL